MILFMKKYFREIYLLDIILLECEPPEDIQNESRINPNFSYRQGEIRGFKDDDTGHKLHYFEFAFSPLSTTDRIRNAKISPLRIWADEAVYMWKPTT